LEKVDLKFGRSMQPNTVPLIIVVALTLLGFCIDGCFLGAVNPPFVFLMIFSMSTGGDDKRRLRYLLLSSPDHTLMKIVPERKIQPKRLLLSCIIF
jgi:hypothetical protein